ncbi:hypothetical protein [Mycobacterium sp.]|uniref:hypothetical protein n=1 Tax=Mycobacterium sp. TaxID=1785 RepID=UPI003BACB294
MSIAGRYPRLEEKLREAVLDTPATTDVALRRAAYCGDDVPGPLGEYVHKLRQHAYRVQDDDIEHLRAAGYSDDHIFEVCIAAALGAGNDRLNAGLSALYKVAR